VNKGIQKALKKAKSKKSSKVSAATKLRKELKKCNRKVLVYSKKKKTVKCVKTLQKYLNERVGTKLKADGWFGKETTKAVKKYQEKFSKSYGLKATGKVNLATYNVMIGKGKKKVDTKAVKKELLNSFNPNKKKTSKKTSKSKPTQIGKTITIKSDTTGILK
jgi:peptidoglycan hydrolase-like protein with peptidoglycan-binding domain